MKVVRARCVLSAFLILDAWASSGAPAQALSAPFAVDSRADVRRSVGSAAVGYAPVWSTGSSVSGANVVLARVDRPDTAFAVTTTVATCAADASGVLTVAPSGATDYCRLLHRVELNGTPVGEVLACDMAFGVTSAPGTAFAADSRPGSLQLIACERGTARLVYDTAWTNGVTRLSVAVIDGVATNELLSVDAAAAGTYDYRMNDPGWKRFLLTFCGDGATVVGRWLSEPFRVSGGLTIILK